MNFKYIATGILTFGFGWGILNAQYDPFTTVAKYEEYKYSFLDANFRKQREEAKEVEDIKSLFDNVVESVDQSQTDLSHFEKKVQAAVLLKDLKQFHPASLLLMEVAKKNIGNKIGELALYELNGILLNDYILEDRLLLSYFNQHSFEGLHSDVQAMVDYYRARYFYKKNFVDWTKDKLNKIPESSPWALRMKMDSLLYEIVEQGMEFPFQKVKDFHQKWEEKLGQIDKERLYLISARFLFEQGEFEKAFRVYEGISAYTSRLKGQLILEMAWAKYYSQDYSHAMGLLELLKAPYFDASLSTGRFLLESLIYRQLCYFDNLSITEKSFNKRFASAFKASTKRFDHTKNLVLANMGLLDEDLAPLAQAFDDLENFKFAYKDFLKNFENFASVVETRKENLEKFLNSQVEKRVPKIMNHILVAKQEMSYLSYLANLDKMRDTKNIKSYEAEKIEKFKFDKLFWKSNGEFWLDELNDFRVLINSRCEDNS